VGYLFKGHVRSLFLPYYKKGNLQDAIAANSVCAI